LKVDIDLRQTVGKFDQIGLAHLVQNVERNNDFISRGLKPLRVSAVIPHGLGGAISVGSHREEDTRGGIRHLDDRPGEMPLEKGKRNKSNRLQESCNPGREGWESGGGRGGEGKKEEEGREKKTRLL